MKFQPGDRGVDVNFAYITYYICTADHDIYQYDIFENGKCVAAATSCPVGIFDEEVRRMTKLEKALK